MKRFLAYARDLTVAERKIWEQAGFDIVTADAAATCGEEDPPIDLALLGASEFLPESLTPKVFVVSAKTAGDASPDWQRRYEVRFYSAGAHGWIIGSKTETPPPNDWGVLLVEKNVAAFAESLYYYLLRDVFRETAEWCGHMSSAVRRL